MKTALVHDWLITPGGAEKVLEAIWNLYPSPIFTLFDGKILPGKQVNASFLQKMPGALSSHRYYLPFFPLAIQHFDLSEFDVILSSSHAVAKGIRKREDQLHICYCHTPMRYAWDLEAQYMQPLGKIQKWGAQAVLKYLRKWDQSSVSRVDHFIANSRYVAHRIQRIYGREALVIYPPVSTDAFFVSNQKEDYYITLSRLVPYKRIDLMIEAFAALPDRKLIVIGDGPEFGRLKMSAPSNVELLGRQSDESIKQLLSRAKAFIFAAEEDFGIAPVEAQAAGIPVIAYGKGGVTETVIAEETGIFFEEQTSASLIKAVKKCEQMEFEPKRIVQNAKRFNEARFAQEYKQFIQEKWEDFCENHHSCRR